MQSVLTRPQEIATVQIPAQIPTVQIPTVIRPQGHMNADRVPAFQDQLTKAVMSPTSDSLTVDMSQVESLDSAGLMTLVSTLNLAQRLNKRFNLCSLSAPTRIILELTQLDRAFEIVEAVAA
jgi:anti-sigma B factor antagonist